MCNQVEAENKSSCLIGVGCRGSLRDVSCSFEFVKKTLKRVYFNYLGKGFLSQFHPAWAFSFCFFEIHRFSIFNGFLNFQQFFHLILPVFSGTQFSDAQIQRHTRNTQPDRQSNFFQKSLNNKFILFVFLRF